MIKTKFSKKLLSLFLLFVVFFSCNKDSDLVDDLLLNDQIPKLTSLTDLNNNDNLFAEEYGKLTSTNKDIKISSTENAKIATYDNGYVAFLFKGIDENKNDYFTTIYDKGNKRYMHIKLGEVQIQSLQKTSLPFTSFTSLTNNFGITLKNIKSNIVVTPINVKVTNKSIANRPDAEISDCIAENLLAADEYCGGGTAGVLCGAAASIPVIIGCTANTAYWWVHNQTDD